MIINIINFFIYIFLFKLININYKIKSYTKLLGSKLTIYLINSPEESNALKNADMIYDNK